MTSPRVYRVPTPAWVLGSLLLLIGSLVGAGLVHRAADQINESRFDAMNAAVDGALMDRIDGLGVLLAGIGGYYDAADAVGAADVRGYLAAVARHRPGRPDLNVDGVIALAIVPSIAELDSPETVLGLGGLEGVLSTPSGRQAALAAVRNDRATLSEPIEVVPSLPSVQVLYLSVGDPTTVERQALIAFLLAPADLLRATLGEQGDGTLDATLTDQGTVIGEVGEGAGSVPSTEIDTFARTWQLAVRPGPSFPFYEAGISVASLVAMGLVSSLLVFILGVSIRSRDQHQVARIRLAEDLNAEKDRFIASVSHELRTPLTAVLGLTEELAGSSGAFEASEVEELIGLVATQSREMSHLIEDLLAVARNETGTIVILSEPVDLAAEVQRILDEMLPDVQARTKLAGGPSIAKGDPLRVRQVLRNLITNAVRYGGPSIEVAWDATADHARLIVADDGAGIPPDEQETIFAPYHRAAERPGQPASVGLGLTVARQLAVAMGGDLTYRYTNGRSVFELRLPLLEDGWAAPPSYVGAPGPIGPANS